MRKIVVACAYLQTLADEGSVANSLQGETSNAIKAKPLAKLPYRVCSGCRQCDLFASL